MPYRPVAAPVFRREEFEVIDRTPAPGFLRRLFRRGPLPPAAYACGHEAPVRFAIRVRGELREMSGRYFEERPLCPECIRIGAIRCAQCGEPILPGEGVACVIDDPAWSKPWKVRAGERSVVICFRRTCAGPFPEMGGGFWNGRDVASSWDFDDDAKPRS